MINQTTDYSIFKIHPLNRGINKGHVNRIADSMQRKLTFTLIKVDRDMQIVDGQHRFEALKRLGKPIYYVQDDFDTIDMINENTNQKNWGLNDYISHYADKGIKSYKDLLGLSKIHKIPTHMILAIYKEHSYHQAYVSNHNRTQLAKDIKSGNFDFNENRLHEKLTKIRTIADCFELSKYPSYLLTAIDKIQRHKDYDHKRMLHKCKTFSYMYEKRNKLHEYVELLETIYNYKTSDKVSFKY